MLCHPDPSPCHPERSEGSQPSVGGKVEILHCVQDDKEDAQDDQTEQALSRIWRALHDVEDPEIPVSVVGMGLIVSVTYHSPTQTARLQITYTAMGCPAMDMIQDDIRARLLQEPDIDAVDIEVVWDPIWSRKRLSDAAKATMRQLGIAV